MIGHTQSFFWDVDQWWCLSSVSGELLSSWIQNTRSHIPLRLQFLHTTESNKGTTVIRWQNGALRREETAQPMSLSARQACWNVSRRQKGSGTHLNHERDQYAISHFLISVLFFTLQPLLLLRKTTNWCFSLNLQAFRCHGHWPPWVGLFVPCPLSLR